MATRDPFRNFEATRRMMDSLFEGAALPEIDHLSRPAINLYEKDGTYTIECAVPGYKKDEIKVEARSDQVLISGSYSREAESGQSADAETVDWYDVWLIQTFPATDTLPPWD